MISISNLREIRRQPIRSVIVLVVYLITTTAALSSPASDIKNLIKVDGKGRILSVDYKETVPNWNPKTKRNEYCWNPMCAGHSAVLKSLKQYAPGCKCNELLAVLGPPRALERNVPTKSWPKRANQSQEVWMYTVGPSGWSTTFVLTFSDSVCTDFIVLDTLQSLDYAEWKVSCIEAYVVGKNENDIVREFGEPGDRKGPKRLEFWTKDKGNVQNYVGDETWTYQCGDSDGVWVGVRNGACVTAQNFISLH